MLKAAYCRACWGLAETDRAWLDGLLAAGKLPRGVLRRLGVSKWTAYRHRRHQPGRGGRLAYYGVDWRRRKAEGQRLASWRWRPGASGREQCARAKREAAERRELAAAYREAAARLRGE